MASRVVSKADRTPVGFKWLGLKLIEWEDPLGRRRTWESAERTTRRGKVDGVAIVAKILRAGQQPLLPVLKQYRPPIANYCLELPAGLVDASETAGQAAVRELKEETGYTGVVADETPVCCSDPGMSNANMQYVVLTVDGDAPENQGVRQQLEDGEFIEVELVPWNGLLHHIKAEVQRTGCDVDARLLSYAFGLEHAKEAASLVVAAAAAAASKAHRARNHYLPAQQAAAPAGPAGGGASSSSSSAAVAPLPFGSPVGRGSLEHSRASAPPRLSLDAEAAAAACTLAASGGTLRSAPWLLFVAGATAGSAACWLLLGRGRSGGAQLQ